MSQRTHGIWAILSSATAYASFQNLVGAKQGRAIFIRDFVRPAAGDRVLDVGCGTAEIIDNLTNVDYVGIDLSPKYIAAATAKYGGRGSFYVADVSELKFKPEERFNIVMVMGVFHHLDDSAVLHLCRAVGDILAPGGRLVSLDPTFVEGQHPLSRMLIKADRGLNVRGEPELKQLVGQAFREVKSTVRNDLMRIPYTHLMLECTN